jgi:hypothetical protein
MNMLIIGGYGDDDDKMFLIVRATNIGGKKTTITNVLIFSYKSVWEYLRNRPSFTAIFNNTEPAFPLPYVLDVGHDFMNKADQSELTERIRDTYFYAGVQHSFSDKPVMVRVKYSDPKK